MGNIETTTKFSRLKSISSKILKIDNCSFILVIYLFSRVCLQLQMSTIIFILKKMFIEIGFKEV